MHITLNAQVSYVTSTGSKLCWV